MPPMNSHTKTKETKPVPIERVLSREHFAIRLEPKLLMVPELWFNGSNGLASFLIRNIDFLEPISREP